MRGERRQHLRRDQRNVDRQDDGDAVRGRAQPGDDPGERSAHVAPVVEHRERQLERVGGLADGEPLVAAPPSTRQRARERLSAELRQRLRRAEARARAADEQHAGQPVIRHGSV